MIDPPVSCDSSFHAHTSQPPAFALIHTKVSPLPSVLPLVSSSTWVSLPDDTYIYSSLDMSQAASPQENSGNRQRQDSSASDLWEDSLAYYTQDDIELREEGYTAQELRPPNTGEPAALVITGVSRETKQHLCFASRTLLATEPFRAKPRTAASTAAGSPNRSSPTPTVVRCHGGS